MRGYIISNNETRPISLPSTLSNLWVTMANSKKFAVNAELDDTIK